MTRQDTLLLQHGPYIIRRAQASDQDRLVGLVLELQDHLEASNPALWRMTTKARSDLRGQIAGRLEAENNSALVAEHAKDGVVGVIFGRVIVNNRYTPSRAGQIDQAFVCVQHRRMGIGSQLVAALCRVFAAEGVKDVTVRYAVGNREADTFWTALGLLPRITIAGASREIIERRTDRGFGT